MLNRCHSCKKIKPFVTNRSFFEPHVNSYITSKEKLCKQCFNGIKTDLGIYKGKKYRYNVSMKQFTVLLLIILGLAVAFFYFKNRCPKDMFFVPETNLCVPFRNEIQQELYNK